MHNRSAVPTWRPLRLTGVVLFALLLAALGCGAPAAPSGGNETPQGAPRRVLVVTYAAGFRHDSIPAAETALAQMAAETGVFSPEFCRTAEDVRTRLTLPELASTDAVVFANTTGDLGVPDVPALLDWIASGRGFVGVHSASDTYRDLPAYVDMLGGQVVAHGGITEAEVRVREPAHPAVAHLSPTFRATDEWYRFGLAGSRTVLLALERTPDDGLGVAGSLADMPLAWQKSHGTGRVLYTALGHRAEIWADSRFRRHLLEGIRWAAAR